MRLETCRVLKAATVYLDLVPRNRKCVVEAMLDDMFENAGLYDAEAARQCSGKLSKLMLGSFESSLATSEESSLDDLA